ncbi:JNK1/MAPK8-associated membrane protein-like [Panonychus citri]|uniref:JNK1/MAPK8-associated membrane protein-like n=1 Tax=Panonychus citri TaxID=50023 RepID=UPI002306E6AE|nr:JNK1/MAPK8-associated membrane protein-like [Panonychus citri]
MFNKCPGIYCGRVIFDNETISQCMSCPSGTRSSTSYPFTPSTEIKVPSQCIECSETLGAHDWFYLGFMALILLIMEWYIIDYSIRRRHLPFEVLIVHLSALVEISLAALLTLLSFSTPVGSLNLKCCGAYRIADWYTLFFNPSVNFKDTIRCAQEAVYPLYSMIFLFYFLCLAHLITIRPWVIRWVSDSRAPNTIYLTLYVIPALTVSHALFSGLIYYSFPFLTLVSSTISIAAHFAYRLDQSMEALFLKSFENIRSMIILFGHWLLHAYGIVSLTKFKNPVMDSLILLLVPFPSAFYILTSKFSDPSKLHLH